MFDVPRLIEEVKKRPALWDFAHPNRYNRAVLDAHWEEVGRLFGTAPDEPRRKWKGLRDTFRKELRKYPNGFNEDIPPDQPTWVFFAPLYFLKGQMKARQRIDIPAEAEYVLDLEKLKDDTENSNMANSIYGNNSNNEDLVDISSDVGEPINDELASAENVSGDAVKPFEDEDYHFFMSLLPHVRKLQPQHKLHVRAKIQDLVCREVYGSGRTVKEVPSGGAMSSDVDPLL